MAPFPDDLVEALARAIYKVRPDCLGKPWPIVTERDRRAYPHNPIAAVDLSYEYARAALQAHRAYWEAKSNDESDSQ